MTAKTHNPNPSSGLSILGWVSYDFANTIFSAVVLTAYFPLYLTELSGRNIYLGIASTLSMVLAGLAVPVLGTLSDQTGKTKSYLFRTTLAAVFTLSLFTFTQSVLLLVVLFIISCFFYHSSLVFYNSLLPVSAPPEKQGFVSGLGTGAGYLGVVIVLPFINFIDSHLGPALVFITAGILFFISALPLFCFVPERKTENPEKFRWGLLKAEWHRTLKTISGLSSQPAALLFFGGTFFAVDAVNSMIFWFMVYTREVFHPEQSTLIYLLMAVNAAAFVWGVISGVMTDRMGALKTLLFGVFMLTVNLLILPFTQSIYWFSAVILTAGAFSIACIWTSGRKALLEFAPEDQIGAYFGLYGLTTKISVIGSLIFSVIADIAGFQKALWALIFPAGTGFLFLLFSYALKEKDSRRR